jgi:hypothetical protein
MDVTQPERQMLVQSSNLPPGSRLVRACMKGNGDNASTQVQSTIAQFLLRPPSKDASN